MGRRAADIWNHVVHPDAPPGESDAIAESMGLPTGRSLTKERFVCCKYCYHRMTKNATRIKAHLGGRCGEAPDNVRREFSQSHGSGLIAINHHDEEDGDEMDDHHASNFKKSAAKKRKRSYLKKMKSIIQAPQTSTEDFEIIDSMLARAIYSSGIPFQTIANPYWQELLAVLRRGYKTPSQEALSDKRLGIEYQRVKSEVQKTVNEAGEVSLVSSGWSNVIGEQSRVNFICTTPKPIFATAETFPENPMAESISQMVMKHINEIGKERVIAFVADYTEQMKDAWVILQERNPGLLCFGCGTSSLHLLVDNICKINSVKSVMDGAIAVVRFIKQNRTYLLLLLEQLELDNSKKFSPFPRESAFVAKVTSMKLLYNMHIEIIKAFETQRMVEHGIENPHIKAEMTKVTRWLQNRANLEALHQTIQLLEPFQAAILETEKETPTLSRMFYVWNKLLKHIECSTYPKLTEISRMFDETWSFVYNPAMLLAYMLDPTVNNLLEIHPEFENEITRQIKRFSVGTNHVNPIAQFATFRAREGQFKDEAIWSAASKCGVVTWWKSFGRQTPDLQKIAIRLLTIPAASVSYDQSWSSHSFVRDREENCLSPENADKLLYLFWNLRLLRDVKSATIPSSSSNVICDGGHAIV